jgi:hypothetical protein
MKLSHIFEKTGTGFLFCLYILLIVSSISCTMISYHKKELAPSEEYVKIQPVDTIKIVTDHYPDTTSLEGIVNFLIKPNMTDEEKVIALYNWYRRLVFHYRYMGPDRREVMRVINSYGFNLCGSQAATFVMILNKAGFTTRVVCGEAGKGFGGHTFVEVKYGDKWHALDTMTSFFVYNRDNPPTIASLEEMKNDPSLVANAIAENRAPPAFLYCRHNPEITTNDIPKLESLGYKADRRWATFTFEGGELPEYWKRGVLNWRVLDNGTYGAKYDPALFNMILKPNEEYVRLWDNVGKWLAKPSYEHAGPHHTCGHVDEYDDINFKYFEPYKKENFGLTRVCYRYYGNGWLDWTPMRCEEIQDAASAITNLVCTNNFLEVKTPAAEGSITLPVKCPYAIVETIVEIETREKASFPVVSMIVGKQKINLQPVKEPSGNIKYIHTEKENPIYEYNLTISVSKDTSFRLIRLKNIFQLNIYSLPGFVPGKNTVTVSAKNPTTLTNSALIVTYEWDEGPEWKTHQILSREITQLPCSYEVNVAGPKMPRMKRLSIKLVKK